MPMVQNMKLPLSVQDLQASLTVVRSAFYPRYNKRFTTGHLMKYDVNWRPNPVRR
jgi:hypothetical protein